MKSIISDLGEIKIHKNLITQIVEVSALSVEGISSIAIMPVSIISKILRQLKIKGIKIDVANELRIEIPVNVKYGYNIPEVAANLQSRILESLAKSLSIDTAYIIVKVKGLEK